MVSCIIHLRGFRFEKEGGTIVMDPELGIFRQLVLWVWDNRRKIEDFKASASSLHSEVLRMFDSLLNREELERSLPADENVRNEFPSRRFLYLDPIESDGVMIPVLWMSFDFSRFHPLVRIYLCLFLRYENQIRSLGYRFEAPEGEGIHHYYHAQIIRGMPPGIPFHPPELHDWLPEGQPSFPLDAYNPTELLLCLLLALYGREYVTRLISSMEAGLHNQLKRSIGEMSWISIGPVRWYWVVRNRDSKQIRQGFETSRNPEYHREIMRTYPGCEWAGITRAAYNDLPAGRKRSIL